MADTKFDLILVGYRQNDTTKAIDFCNNSFGAELVQRKILVLNSRMDLTVVDARSWEVVEGSNLLGEFSGWQEGLSHRKIGVPATSGVIFVNDSVVTHRHFSGARRRALVRAIKSAPHNAMIGFTDQLNGTLSVLGFQLDSSWVSTYCFALTTRALSGIDGKLFELSSVESCVPGGLDESRFFANVSSDLATHLRNWLFRDGWYAGGELNAANSSRLQRKALSIIAEKLLSARCRAASIEIVDPFQTYPGLSFLDRVNRRLST